MGEKKELLGLCLPLAHRWQEAQSNSALFIKLEATKMSDILFTYEHNLHFLESIETQHCLRNLPGCVSSDWTDILSSDRTDTMTRRNILKYLHYEITSTTKGHLNPSAGNPCALNPF